MHNADFIRVFSWICFALLIGAGLTACSSSEVDTPAPIVVPRTLPKKVVQAPAIEPKKVEVEEVAKKVEVEPVEEPKPATEKPATANAEKKRGSNLRNSLRKVLFKKRTSLAPTQESSARSVTMAARVEPSLSRREFLSAL